MRMSVSVSVSVIMRRSSRSRAGPALGRQRHHHRGDAGNGAHRLLRPRPDVFPDPRLGRLDVDREEHLAVVRGDLRQHLGDAERHPARGRDFAEAVENLLFGDAQNDISWRTQRSLAPHNRGSMEIYHSLYM